MTVSSSRGSKNSLFCNTSTDGSSLVPIGSTSTRLLSIIGLHRIFECLYSPLGNNRGDTPLCSPDEAVARRGWTHSSNHAGNSGDGSPSTALHHRSCYVICHTRYTNNNSNIPSSSMAWHTPQICPQCCPRCRHHNSRV